jgi:hypothetical protein
LKRSTTQKVEKVDKQTNYHQLQRVLYSYRKAFRVPLAWNCYYADLAYFHERNGVPTPSLRAETCKRQVQRRGRALQRPQTARIKSSLFRAVLKSALFLNIAAALSTHYTSFRATSVDGAFSSGAYTEDGKSFNGMYSPRGDESESSDALASALWWFFVVKVVQEIAMGVRIVLESHPHITSLDVFAVLKNNPPTYWGK